MIDKESIVLRFQDTYSCKYKILNDWRLTLIYKKKVFIRQVYAIFYIIREKHELYDKQNLTLTLIFPSFMAASLSRTITYLSKQQIE